MKNISAWAIRHPVTPIVLFMVLFFLGTVSFIRLPINLQPDVSFPEVDVNISEPGVLVQANDLPHLLYRWADADEGVAVREWTNALMKEDAGIERLAEVFTGSSWSHTLGGLGDTVARRTTRAQIDNLDRVLDAATFRARVEELGVRPDASPVVIDFLRAWQRREQYPGI